MSDAALFALNVAKPLIEKLARKLVQKYKDDGIVTDPTGDLLPTADEMIVGLTQLLKEGKLNLGGATEEGEFKNSLLDLVRDQIKDLQLDTGSGLLPDGILGRKMLKWITERRSCGMTDRRPKAPGPGPQRNDQGRSVILYFIEEEQLPDGSKAPKLPRLGLGASPNLALAHLSIALESWFMHLNLEVGQTDEPGKANLIITTDLLPAGAPDNYLALTDIGPGPNMGVSLRMTLDKTESWNPNIFQATVAHEFGHALGLKHSDVRFPNQLMNDTLSDIKEPRVHDIEAARQKGWGSRS